MRVDYYFIFILVFFHLPKIIAVKLAQASPQPWGGVVGGEGGMRKGGRKGGTPREGGI